MSARSARWRWSRARHTTHRTGLGAAVAPRSVTFCDWAGRLRTVPHGRQWANSKVLPPTDGERPQGPQGAMGVAPGTAGARRTAGPGTGRGAGWAGRPSLPLLFPCPVRAAGDECGGAEPRPARCVLLGACLPQPGRPVPLAALAWCLFTVQLSTRSPAGGPGPAFAIWGGTTPRTPPPLEARAAEGHLERATLTVLGQAWVSLGVCLGDLLPDERLWVAARWTAKGLTAARHLDSQPAFTAYALQMHGNELRKAGRCPWARRAAIQCVHLAGDPTARTA